MDTWQQYTLRAQTEFRLACYGNAILMHNQALDHARHDFEAVRQRCCLDHAIARVLISHFNLADCYLALDNHERAAGCYVAAQRFLLAVQQSCAVHDEASADALMHARSHLHAQWCELLRQHHASVAAETLMAWHHASEEFAGRLDALVTRH